MRRRHFLQFTGGLASFPVVSQFSSYFPSLGTSETMGIIEGWDFQGNPLSSEAWGDLYFLDLEDNPIFNPPRQTRDGQLKSVLPDFPIIIGVNLAVEGFGNVTLYADNQGQGYTVQDFPLNLNLELTRTRLERVNNEVKLWELEGFKLPLSIQTRLEQSQSNWQNAQNSFAKKEQLQWCQKSLAESLWAGEEAVLAKAEYDLQKRGKRPDFLFGCNFFAFPALKEIYETYFTQVFNFATLPLYWQQFEAVQGQRNFQRLDEMIDWLKDHNIKAKGHPLVWFAEYGIPKWLTDTRFPSMKNKISQHIIDVTEHFGQRMPYYDVINEGAGLAFANQPNYTIEELIEFTKVASLSTHQGNPEAFRIINNCCLWAKYRTNQEPPPYTPYQYMTACIAANIPFEAIGLQLYYPNHDLFEINRLLERFGRLGKVIHITELGVPSATTEDEDSIMKTPFGLWHQPWSETIQADWIEQFYTLCYSKSYIEAITWWDFTDQTRHFWAHGGLLNKEGKPKESFYRLKSLIEKWK